MNRLELQTTEAFGLVAWLAQTKVTLPLKGVECRFEVTAGVASVEIDQIYHQCHAEPLDCTYTFPLPSGAAVYRCEMHVNGRVIRAKVAAREEAKKIFVEQKAAGRRAALVETERDNLFTLSLGNLQPNDVIVIRFAYFQTLERIASEQRLRIPVCPGVRYIPGKPLLRSLSGRGTEDDTDQVPDASRITPPRIDALHPDAAYFAMEGTLARSDVIEESLSSPTHPVLVHAGEEVQRVALANSGAVPDRDLVLRWQEPREAALAPRAWTYRAKGETFALVQLRAPVEVGIAEAFEQDVYFLIDRSGSMAGAKWEKSCEALTGFVKLLGERDRVWITLFESGVLDFAEAPLAAPRVLADPSFLRLVAHGIAGGTELLPAAEHLLAKVAEHSRDRVATIVLITDGEVGNEDEILRRFRRERGVTVHTFGIDTTVNDSFLKRLARQHGGDCWLQTPDDDIAATVAGLADRLRRPVLTELEVRDGWKPATPRLPNVHAGQVIDLCLRRAKPAPISIAGRLGSGEKHVFSLASTPVRNEAVKLLWARECIEASLVEGRRDDALALAKQHNLLCEGAAFVAWDEEEQVAIAGREIIQPSLQPAKIAPCVGAAMPLCSLNYPSASWLGGTEFRASERLESRRRTYDSDPSRSRRFGGNERDVELDLLRRLLTMVSLPPALVDALLKWMASSRLAANARYEALFELGGKLSSLTSDIAAQTALCREFIATHLPPKSKMSARLLAAVAEWEGGVKA